MTDPKVFLNFQSSINLAVYHTLRSLSFIDPGKPGLLMQGVVRDAVCLEFLGLREMQGLLRVTLGRIWEIQGNRIKTESHAYSKL